METLLQALIRSINVDLKFVEDADRTWVDKGKFWEFGNDLRRLTRKQFIKYIIRSPIQNHNKHLKT